MAGLNINECRIEGGRWPANVILDEEAAELLGETSRFFYCAKASKKVRSEVNTHPTVKPLELMRYFVRLTKTPQAASYLTCSRVQTPLAWPAPPRAVSAS